MKKFFCVLLTLVLVSGLVCFASAEEDEPVTFVSGDYKYVLREDGSAEITNYSGKEEKLSIPSELDGKKVTAIRDYAFSNCRSLTSVTIPDSVAEIGNNPFFGCSSLTEIIVSPDHPTLDVINQVLFSKPDKRLVCYPRGLTAYEYTIPRGIQVIGDHAFSGCDFLTSVTIPDSVTSIGDYAFSRCIALSPVIIPDSVTEIGSNPFDGCSSLTEIIVSPDHPALTVIDQVLFSKPDKRLVCYPRGLTATEYTIPQGIQIIGDIAFSGCKSLTSVTIPDSVISINKAAFSGCESLTSISIPGSVTSIGDSAFSSCDSLTSVTIPDSVTSIGRSSFYGCKSLTSFTIPDSVTSIGELAFYNYSSLTSVIVPDSVTSIGDSAFSSCKSLTSFTIPDSVTSIGEFAFYNCSSLTSFTIPDSVTSIGEFTFDDCPATFTVGKDSYAQQYCIDNNLPYTCPD